VTAVRRGHTTGASLLAPWANRLGTRRYRAAGRTVTLRGLPLHTDEHGLPIHGTMVGERGWVVTGLGRGRVEATFAAGEGTEHFAAFPFLHSLRIGVRVGPRRLRVDTTVDATDGGPVPVSFGWHPYWRMPGARDGWSVQLPDVAHARLDRRGIPTGRARVEPAGPPANAFIEVAMNSRRLGKSFIGAPLTTSPGCHSSAPGRLFRTQPEARCCTAPRTPP